MDTTEPTVTQTDLDEGLPEDIRRIPPEHRDAELRRLAEKERPRHEMLMRELAADLGIPYP